MKDSELDNLLRGLASRKMHTPDLRTNVRAEIEQRKARDAGRRALPWAVPVFAGSLAAALAIGFLTTFAARPGASEARRSETVAALHLDSFSAPAVFAPVASLSPRNQER